MDSRKTVFKETGIAAVGVCIGVAVMLGVYALLGKFSRAVLLGGIVGTALGLFNFFFMSIGVCLASDKAVEDDAKGGKKLIKLSYFARLGVLFLILYACAKSGLCEPLALVIPIALVRPSLTVAEFFRKERT